MSTVSTKIDKTLVGKELLSTKEAADLLGLGKETVQHYCQGDEPRLAATKIGRDWLISRSEVERYDRERRDYNRED